MRLLALVALLLSGCSSFGIRTSTNIPTTTMPACTHHCTMRVVLLIDGNVSGAGVESRVPIDKIAATVSTSLVDAPSPPALPQAPSEPAGSP